MLMIRRRFPSDFAFSAGLPNRWRCVCGQPLIVVILAVALVQLTPVGICQSGGSGSHVKSGNKDVAADWRHAMDVGRPTDPSTQIQQHRPESPKTLDLGAASLAATRFALALGRCRDGCTATNLADSTSLVALHIRLQI